MVVLGCSNECNGILKDFKGVMLMLLLLLFYLIVVLCYSRDCFIVGNLV